MVTLILPPGLTETVQAASLTGVVPLPPLWLPLPGSTVSAVTAAITAAARQAEQAAPPDPGNDVPGRGGHLLPGHAVAGIDETIAHGREHVVVGHSEAS